MLITCLMCHNTMIVGCPIRQLVYLLRQLVGRVQLPFKAAMPLHTAITAKRIYHHTMMVGYLV